MCPFHIGEEFTLMHPFSMYSNTSYHKETAGLKWSHCQVDVNDTIVSFMTVEKLNGH